MPKVTPALPRVLSALIGEKAILFAISVNALALFTLALVSPNSTAARVASVVDYACVVLFLAEAAIKIGLERRRYFASAWNRFDFAVVVLSLPVLLSPWIDLQAFAAVLLLRLGRLFRLFHLFHFIPNVDRMMSGVRRSLRASVGVLIALCILLFILSLGAHFLFGQFAPEHFGDPFIAIYSVFRVFTVEGWYELPDAIAQSADSTAWGEDINGKRDRGSEAHGSTGHSHGSGGRGADRASRTRGLWRSRRVRNCHTAPPIPPGRRFAQRRGSSGRGRARRRGGPQDLQRTHRSQIGCGRRARRGQRFGESAGICRGDAR